MPNIFLIKKPHHTEKSLRLNTKNQYAFVVHPDANKNEIKKEISKSYGVTVVAVNTALYKSETVVRATAKGSTKGNTKKYKKAIVTLKPGDIIDIYEEKTSK